MSEYPWREKNNTFTWLSSLYNPFKESIFVSSCVSDNDIKKLLTSSDLVFKQSLHIFNDGWTKEYHYVNRNTCDNFKKNWVNILVVNRS